MPRRNRVDPFGDLHAVPERGRFTGNRGCLVDGDGAVVRHHRGNLWIACRTSFRGRRVGLARPNRWTPVFFLDDAVALAAGHRPCGECRRAAYVAYRDAVATALGRRVRAGDLNRRLAAERLARSRVPGLPAGDASTLAVVERASAVAPTGGLPAAAEAATPAWTGGAPTGGAPEVASAGRAPTAAAAGPPTTPAPPDPLRRAVDRLTWRADPAAAAALPDGTVVLAGAPRLLLGDRSFAFGFAGWHDPRPRPDGPLIVLTPPTSVLALAYGFRPELDPSAAAHRP